jgi:hypothetical protein
MVAKSVCAMNQTGFWSDKRLGFFNLCFYRGTVRVMLPHHHTSKENE